MRNYLMWIAYCFLLLTLVACDRQTYKAKNQNKPTNTTVSIQPKPISIQEPEYISTYSEQAGLALPKIKKIKTFTLFQENVYIAGDNQLFIISPSDEVLYTGTIAKHAQCMTVAPDGMVYIGASTLARDSRHSTQNPCNMEIFVYSPKLILLESWALPSTYSQITSLAVSTDDIWMADCYEKVIWNYDRKWKLKQTIARANPNQENHGIVLLNRKNLSVALDPKGTIWVNNPGKHRVECYASNGQFLSSFGKTGGHISEFWGCCNPQHLCIAKNGYCIVMEYAPYRIKIYDSSGKFIEAIGDKKNILSATYEYQYTLAVSNDMRIYLHDPKFNVIRIFAPQKDHTVEKKE